MKWFKKSFNKIAVSNSRGMTLLEIMIVLAILAGLAGVLVSQVNKRFQKAKVNQAKIAIGEIKKALEMYYTDCGNYPGSLDGLSKGDSGCSNWGPDPYLKNVPKDPWNHEFVYEVSGNNYVVKSYGADGKDGGAGNDQDLNSDEL